MLATQLAKELENNSDKKEELITSDTENDSDSEVEHLNGSTPEKDQQKKRGRKNINLGDLNSIKGTMDNHGASSEEELSGEAIKELKKPRLGESSKTHEKDNDLENFEKENSEELSEEKMVPLRGFWVAISTVCLSQ